MRINSAPIRTLAPAQAYSSYYYDEKIGPEVLRLWKKRLLEKDNFEYTGNGVDHEELIPVDDKLTADIPIEFRMEVVRKMYNDESEEVKAEVERRRKIDGGPVEDELDEKRRQIRLSNMNK